MRVIAGELRGRRLKSPKTNDVRPTSDKVKEAVFSMLYPLLGEGYIAMDVFAGSGSMGIEAISRGASRVYFSDDSRESLALVRENLSICGVTERAVLLSGDFRQNIRRVKESVDVFFLDPPYAAGYILPALREIDMAGNIAPGGYAVCEHSHKEALPEEVSGFKAIRDRKYGAISVTVYQRTEDES